MIDIRDTQESYEDSKISNIGWLRSEHNVADGLKMITKCDALDNVILNETRDIQIDRAMPLDFKDYTIPFYEPTSTKRGATSVNIGNKMMTKSHSTPATTLRTAEHTKTLMAWEKSRIHQGYHANRHSTGNKTVRNREDYLLDAYLDETSCYFHRSV